METVTSIINWFEKERSDYLKPLSKMFDLSLKEDEFTAISEGDGTFKLAPYPEFSPFLYRGQVREFAKCHATLYRKSHKHTEKVFQLAKIHELKLALQNIEGYRDDCIFILGDKFKVDYEALAQHYGLQSRYIDFTTNPRVAAFFSVTEYDEDKNKFKLFKSSGVGVFYKINTAFEFNKPIKILGLQPFSRPAKQFGYGIQCNSHGLNSYSPTKYEFFHTRRENSKIYDYFEGGTKILPNDPVANIAGKINNSNYICTESLRWAMDELQISNMRKQIKFLEKSGRTVGESRGNYISREDRLLLNKFWKEEQEPLFKYKVKHRLTCDHCVE